MATHRRRRNAGGSVDTGSARELELFVENDAQLHRSQEVPIQKNLITKMARGVYNHNGAVKLYGYLMENGAKKYNREYGGGGSVWHEMFNTATRKAAAERFASSFETEAKLGNYDYLLPKKYQKSKSNPGRGTTVPAHIRINPRNGRIQVFVTPKVAEKLRGGKGIRVAMNPAQYQIRKGSKRGYYDVVEMQHVPGRRTVGTYPVSTWKSKEDAQIEADRLNRLQEKIK